MMELVSLIKKRLGYMRTSATWAVSGCRMTNTPRSGKRSACAPALQVRRRRCHRTARVNSLLEYDSDGYSDSSPVLSLAPRVKDWNGKTDEEPERVAQSTTGAVKLEDMR
jgi:hypothetical protein